MCVPSMCFGLPCAHDDLVADEQVGDHVGDLETLRIDVHAADDDIDALA